MIRYFRPNMPIRARCHDRGWGFLFGHSMDANTELARPWRPMLDLSPKERARVHTLINDPRTANDPTARDRNVKGALALFLEHQLWEKAHPGELWDAPKK